jgi:hypothetical protein
MAREASYYVPHHSFVGFLSFLITELLPDTGNRPHHLGSIITKKNISPYQPTHQNELPHLPHLSNLSHHLNDCPHNRLLGTLNSRPRRSHRNPPPSRNLHPTSARRRRRIRDHTRRVPPPSLAGSVHGREVLGTWYAVPTSVM